jgi:ferredoxin--NADP+ reductase
MGERVEFAAGLVFRSIGYKGIAIPGVPFDERQGIFPTKDGRIVDQAGAPIPGLYASGWIKRGPTGIIGTNKPDSVATVASILADVPSLDSDPRPGAEALTAVLASRGTQVVSYEDWLAIDEAEVSRGMSKGKPREKFCRVEEMLELLGTRRG